MKLSACYMVKNEERNLPQSIVSLQAAVDELIVVDTGSTDQTKTIATAYGAQVYDFPWQDNFSVPRNFALEQAVGDWIIFLDADESFIHPTAVRSAVELAVASQPDCDGILIPRGDVDDAGRIFNEDYSLRIFPRREDLRYQGRIHENIRKNGPMNLYHADEKLYIRHTGYRTGIVREKCERNLAYLQREIAERGEGPQYDVFLADCYFGLQDYDKALHSSQRALESGIETSTGRSGLHHIRITSLRQLDAPLWQQLQAADEAIAEYPDCPEFYGEKGMILCGMKEPAEAYLCLKQAVSLYEHRGTAKPTYESYIEGAVDIIYSRIAELEDMAGNTAQARANFERALAINPDNQQARKLYEEFRLEEQERGGARMKISGCYMVKNEAKDLESSIQSIRNQVDELIVVDTGSTDGTVELAELLGAKVWQMDWQEDFSAPRNLALDKAAGDWIVFLDADESFTPETAGNLRKLLLEQTDSSVEGLLIERLEIDTDKGDELLGKSYVLRVFRNQSRLAYEGRIHEELRVGGNVLKNCVRVSPELLQIRHTGYSSSRSRSKAERNLRFLQRELRESKDPAHYYSYLADAYMGLDDFAQAAHFAKLDTEQGRRQNTYASRSWRILLELSEPGMLLAAEREKICRGAVEMFPEIPEFRADYAESLAAKGDYAEAVCEMQQALDCYYSYDGLEPTLFTAAMAEVAAGRMRLWKQELPDVTSEQAADALRQMFLVLAQVPDVSAYGAYLELLPTAMQHCLLAFHGLSCTLSAEEESVYPNLLEWLAESSDPAILQKFLALSAGLSDETRCESARCLMKYWLWEDAMALYQSIPADSPAADGTFWKNVGICLFQQHEEEAAAECFDRPLMEKVCSLFIDLGDTQLAKEAVTFLMENFRGNGYLLFLQGRTAGLEKDYERGIQLCQQALQDTGLPGWQRELCHNILGRMYRFCGMANQAAAAYLAASQCEGTAAVLDDYSNYLFNLHYRNENRQFFYEAAQKYESFIGEVIPFTHEQPQLGQLREKLRIGYVSPDFRYHVVAFFCYVMLMHYDHSRFEVYAYAKCEEDEVSREFAAVVDYWTNIRRMSAQEAADAIHADQIDILVDLSGHTADNCLSILAWRPAPVQISGIGWFDTTGMTQVDYFLTDLYLDPAGLNDAYFSEKLLRLPHSHFCYMWHNKPQSCAPAPFRKNGFITFGTLNHFAKITDRMLVLWREILEQVAGSRLFLKNHTVDISYGRKCLEDRLRQAGISTDRVILEGYSDDFLSAYSQLDIALDTYPYPGGATTCDALYMGVPVLTRVGKGHNPRFGYSLLMNMGMEELCACSDEEYVRKAVALANDKEHLVELHQTLRRRMRQSPVMDEGMYMAELEEAYLRVWQTYTGKSAATEEVSAQECARRGVSYLQEAGETSQQRAVYWLHRALAGDAENRVEIAGFLAEACHEQLDYQGEYEAAWQAVAALAANRHPVSREIRRALYVRAANAALTMGDYPRAMETFRQAEEYSDSLAEKNKILGSLLLTAHYTGMDSQQLFELHRPYSELFASVKPFEHSLSRHQHRKLRIGYLSPDFRQHVLFAFYYGILCCYDNSAFEVTGYQLNAETDGFTELLRQQTNFWRDLSGLTWEEAARRIAADEIDILVDLAGHSADTGLPILAWKPAPVQISGIGYMATTALPAVDYFLTDSIVDPPGEHEGYFTERLLYLPSQFCYAGRSDVPVPGALPVRRTGHILFGVFNHYRKITDEMLMVWCAILAAVPDAELLLKSQELVSDSLVQAAYERLRKIGFDMDRVHFEPATTNYMERYLDVDIALDTYPYPGGGTTLDALYMGVPVITRYGERRNTRFGLSILQNLGLSELAADTPESYIQRAVALAGDQELLTILHQNLRGMMQGDTALEPRHYMKQLEQRYKEIWITYQTGRE
jgi:predicted O-linked N-acetylglucosamine transferase (SPINDLY family)/glycosyltransferase involved in cell wall biosynthesis